MGVTVGVPTVAIRPVRVAGVPVPAVAMAVCSVGVAVARVCRRLCETAQSHDAETNTAKRQTERVGIHEWMCVRLRPKRE